MDGIIQSQIDYYRARAAEYDEWFFRQGRYDQGPERNAAWFRDMSAVEAALTAAKPRGDILEIACGTGLWTRRLAPLASHVTALDAVGEMIELNRRRVGADNVTYVEANVFEWRPVGRFDFGFFGFWISHIPRDKWDGSWEMLARALRPDGTLFFVDNRFSNFREVDCRSVSGSDAHEERVLNDGRRFTIVKNFFAPQELEADLAARGWKCTVRETEHFLMYGTATRVKAA